MKWEEKGKEGTREEEMEPKEEIEKEENRKVDTQIKRDEKWRLQKIHR